MKKITNLWTQADGTKIRICDMTDTHLTNTIKLLERAARVQLKRAALALCPFGGDMATDEFDRMQEEADQILTGQHPDRGISDVAEETYPIYAKLREEADRRKLTIE